MDAKAGNKILLTGASGFIATRLAQFLSERGCSLVGCDQRGPGSPLYADFYETDITRPVDPSLMADVDTVFHLAGKAHALAEVKQDEEDYYRINTLGTKNVLEAARAAGVRRFVFFSTVKAMSRDSLVNSEEKRVARPFDETDTVSPDTPYGISKLEGEDLVLKGGYVPEPVVLRLCMVYGAGAKGNIQKMLDAVNRGRFPSLPECGNRRSMVHVRDVIQAAMLASERAEAVGQVFIVSDGKAYSSRNLYEMMCRAVGRSIPAMHFPLWLLQVMGTCGDVIGKVRGKRFVFDSDALEKLVGSAWFSSKKIESLLGFDPEMDFEKALPEMVEAMRNS